MLDNGAQYPAKMSVQAVDKAKPKDRRCSVNVTMAVVHKTNRSEDKKLERQVEHLKQREHQGQVRHCTEVRKLEKELESMQIEVEQAPRTFTKKETETRDVPYLFGKKIAANQPRKFRQRRCRGDSAAAALNRVAQNVEMTGKNRFRSAVLAVCAAKGLKSTATVAEDKNHNDQESEHSVFGENDGDSGTQHRVAFSARSETQRQRTRLQTYPTQRPYTSPGKTLSRRSTGLAPASTSHEIGPRNQTTPASNSVKSMGRRNTVGNLSLARSSESPSPTPTVSLPDLVGAARASIVHAAESAKRATVLKRRGSAVNTVTAAERELERRRSSAALRMQEIKDDLLRRDVDLQDRVQAFMKTSMHGESTVKSPRRPYAIPVSSEEHSKDSE